MRIIEMVGRGDGIEFLSTFPYGEWFEVSQLSDETRPKDLERVLIELFGIEEIVIDGEVYYKDGGFV